jgi:type I restriction enzyme M protein
MYLSRVNTLMNGAQYADLKVMDSLAPLMSITGGVTEGLPTNPGFFSCGLTLVLTNPPFGSKVTSDRALEDLASRDGVSKRNGKVAESIPQEIAFVNRCLEYLAPGGKLGIVLPDGVLANTSTQYVRDWVLRWAELKAVISLPVETFAPYGAGVKTSLVFLEKRGTPLPITPNQGRPRRTRRVRNGASNGSGDLLEGLPVLEEPAVTETTAEPVPIPVEEDYAIFMARIDDIGYDATGRLTVPEDSAAAPPEVQDSIAEFDRQVGWV